MRNQQWRRSLRVIPPAMVLLAGCAQAPVQKQARPTPSPAGLPAAVEVAPAAAPREWDLTMAGGPAPTTYGMVMTGRDDGWILSVCGECSRDHNMRVSRWNGHVWKAAFAPGSRPRAIAASAADNVWLFGLRGRAWRWDGRGWRTATWPDPYPPGAERRRWPEAAAVVGDEVWVSGWDEVVRDFTDRRGFLLHRAGGRWETLKPPGDMVLERFGVLGPDEIWALARVNDQAEQTVYRIVRWDGSAWAEVPLPAHLAAAKVQLHDLTAVSRQEIWVVGEVVVPYKDPLPLALRWDGHQWVVPARPAGRQYLTAVTSDGRGGIWVGAQFWDEQREPRVLHFDGRRWTYERTPHTESAPVVFHLDRIPGTDRIVAVGSNPSYDEDAAGFIWTRR